MLDRLTGSTPAGECKSLLSHWRSTDTDANTNVHPQVMPTKSKRIQVMLRSDVLNEIQERAKAEDKSLSRVVSDLVRIALSLETQEPILPIFSHEVVYQTRLKKAMSLLELLETT